MKLRIARKVGKLTMKRKEFHRGTTASRSRWRLTRSILSHERRVARRIRRQWSTPTIREVNICDNCDGAPDGGHISDSFCMWTLEDM